MEEDHLSRHRVWFFRVRPTRAEAQRQVRDWLLYCNGLRPHLKLQMKSPNEYYAQLLTAS